MLKNPGFLRCLILPCIGLLGALAGPAAAQTQITVEIGDAAGNPGDSAEIQVNLAVGATTPSTMILFFTFNADRLEPIDDYYQFVSEDLQGNVVTRRGPVRPGPVVDQADKVMTTEIAPGEVGVAIYGLNNEVLTSGGLLTMAFRILESAQVGDEIIIAGDSDSSASPPNAQMPSINVNFENGLVSVGCVAPPAPMNVAATSNRNDGVLVSWSEVPASDAEYRVYRSDTNNSATAVSLGDTWQTSNSFLDVTAGLPDVTPPAGCLGEQIVEPITYYYWVKTRTADGCESAFGGPAQGTRSAKSNAAAASLLPLAPTGNGLVLALAAGTLLLMDRRFRKSQARSR